jgi:hypothetical protein
MPENTETYRTVISLVIVLSLHDLHEINSHHISSRSVLILSCQLSLGLTRLDFHLFRNISFNTKTYVNNVRLTTPPVSHIFTSVTYFKWLVMTISLHDSSPNLETDLDINWYERHVTGVYPQIVLLTFLPSVTLTKGTCEVWLTLAPLNTASYFNRSSKDTHLRYS